ncbi:KUP/HAK/KT family potassium transporter [Levilactobacillus tujiorum]|uniref:Probable potassium transport system protein Kup n=1 Tax=Levilactobacillus tujiorum TaxID=2912243 RepID=A0ABX1L4R8_9LACO|nr:KUP/HAK/KT family potassium transporter [Levilactobacillus tujiorum]MCH5464996.1 KUP/HAK/KT family potassium transporter [Levilactobacillus tujiorum]NLR12053.1 KUP/HAK/KT family potassium transporter [Lactobacillus sp. HBUAS51387]NLR30028.1 KUP/HAK/KT family potassium transporter [Levilactobacillus tujiorum]
MWLTTQKLTGVGMLITLGIVYGDIGTSPLYVMNAIIDQAGRHETAAVTTVMLGSISLIFWTLMLITTVKYILLAMRADNRHEGGIFALYALVRNAAKWLIFPALVGGAALLADGTLTPAVTVTSAVEGLKSQTLGPVHFSGTQGWVLLVVTGILVGLFLVQRLGTQLIGWSFGPLMLIWFSFIGLVGLRSLLTDPGMLNALSPVYALRFLMSPDNHQGIFILGSVFLATTGAEALYSDMGQVGKWNIYGTWPFVYAMLMLSYLGQGAWVIHHATQLGVQHPDNPFYAMVPENWRMFAIGIATVAAIIASQALITGSYTLVHEAIGLKLLPRLRIKFPGSEKSQLYISTVNWLLCGVTLGVVWFFRTSSHMEAAYGLAITITMLMTTLLLQAFLRQRNHRLLATAFVGGFGLLEGLFLIASLAKFMHGGYVTLGITLLILTIMVFWYYGNQRRSAHVVDAEHVSLLDFLPQLQALSRDHEVPPFATNLVYVGHVTPDYAIKRAVVYSILDQQPKRAAVYWFVTVNEADTPYECSYTVETLGTRNVMDVQIYLGFKKPQRLNVYLRQIVNDLLAAGVLPDQTPRYSSVPGRQVGNFKFVMLNQQLQDLGAQDDLPALDRLLIGGRLLLQRICLSPQRWYGLEFSDVVEERVPLFIGHAPDRTLRRK